MKPKILFDLFLAHKSKGLSGIPQETRYLFLILSKSEKFKTFGLLPNYTNSFKKENLSNILDQSKHLLALKQLNPAQSTANNSKLLFKIFRKFRKLFSLIINHKKQHSLHELNPTFDSHVIWRSFFEEMVSPVSSTGFEKCKFMLSTLSLMRRRIPFCKPQIITSEFKFAIFEDLNFINCSSETIPIIRYHDGIPVFSPDLVPNKEHVKKHYNKIKKIENKAIFVCNSPLSLEHLKAISPTAAKNAVVIPCPVNQLKKVTVEPSEILNLVQLYISEFSKKLNSQILDIWNNHFSSYNPQNKYILTLSTLEPKKNHCKLIEAWEHLKRDLKEDIKLIIVGSFGWDYEGIKTVMAPHILKGDILHLEKIPENVKPSLFSFVSCFVFPSIIEGFGIPPIEAQMCELPTIVSDIPAIKYSCSDGSIYFNPYNSKDIAEKIKTTLAMCQNSKNLLFEKALANTKRFSEESILAEWEDFLSKRIGNLP